jgi:hypothetical protein
MYLAYLDLKSGPGIAINTPARIHFFCQVVLDLTKLLRFRPRQSKTNSTASGSGRPNRISTKSIPSTAWSRSKSKTKFLFGKTIKAGSPRVCSLPRTQAGTSFGNRRPSLPNTIPSLLQTATIGTLRARSSRPRWVLRHSLRTELLRPSWIASFLAETS